MFLRRIGVLYLKNSGMAESSDDHFRAPGLEIGSINTMHNLVEDPSLAQPG